MLGPSPAGVPQLTPRALAVARHLLSHGPSSRGLLGDALRLSDASMSRAARSLVREGIVAESLESPSAVGRPRQILTAIPSSRRVVGIKLTGDRAYGVLCDLLGTVTAIGGLALPAKVSGVVPVEKTVKVITRLVQRLSKGVEGIDGLGVSLGGVIGDRALVREGTFLGWQDVDLAALLHAAVGVPVVITNDVTALAREQLWFGAGRTHSTFALITVGAGLGFAVVREGHVVEQLMDNGHLLAHSPIDGSGPECTLGHRGCVAAYLNRDDIAARMSQTAGRPIRFEDLARSPDPATGTWFTEAARALGHLVATVAGALQTDRIVLAGEDVKPLFASPVTAATINERLRPGPSETQRCTLDVSTEPLTFTDWARGAGVVSIQNILGAI